MTARPRLLLDCDGVLADFASRVLTAAGSHLEPDDIMTWDIFEILRITHGAKIANRVVQSLNKPTFWRHLQPYPEARVAMTKLRDVAEIYIVTAPWKTCREWAYVRTLWCEQYFGVDEAHVVIARDKHVLRGDVFVDDRLTSVAAWKEANPDGAAICFARPYNEAAELPPGVVRGEWREVHRAVRHAREGKVR